MNYKEALKEIKYQLKEADGYDVIYWDCTASILEICVKSLEKQIPKQVKKIRHETILGYSETYFCPNCGGSVWQKADESKYCFRCGQAIDWEVSE